MSRRTMLFPTALAVTALAASGQAAVAGAPAEQAAVTREARAGRNPVADWAAILAPAIHNATEPRPPAGAQVLHTLAHLAVYDAAVAIRGRYAPYAADIDAPNGANLTAAVATAAYRAVHPRVKPSQHAYLDGKYAEYMATIPDSAGKAAGVQVGEKAAAAVLAKRARDNFNAVVTYACSKIPVPAGEFEPNEGCSVQPVEVALGKVTPYTFARGARFLPNGPDRFTSARWARDFNEVKRYGRADSAVRTPAQTDVAYFWSEHAYAHWNRNLVGLARARGLTTLQTARLFAMVHTAASDAVIAGFAAKYHYRTWRPRTAIPRAAEDGNPRTAPDANWKPLLSVNHPEYPSGHAFYSGAVTDAVEAFFGTRRVKWTLGTSKEAVPLVVKTERTYRTLDAVMAEVTDARVWSGLHYRNSMTEGTELGRKIARHVTTRHFGRA